MNPEQSPGTASHTAQDAAGRAAIDSEIELGASAAEAAARKRKKNEPELTQTQKLPKYSRRHI